MRESVRAMSTYTGRTLGRYRLERSVGKGGMAEVYAARDATLGRTVAVKVVLAALAAEPELRERFLREARLVAALEHPGILRVYDFGEDDGIPYLVMPFVPGGSLAGRIAGSGLDPALVADWIGQLAAALDAAHGAGVLHRDVKPSNVLVSRDGRPILADFGIARALGSSTRLTVTGSVVGTPSYMAPELVQGAPASPATDRYSLAVLAYEMLSGTPPFVGDHPLSILHQHATAAVPPLSTRRGGLPPELDPLLARALAKDPGSRPESCAVLARGLAEALASAGGAAGGGATPGSPAAAWEPGAGGTGGVPRAWEPGGATAGPATAPTLPSPAPGRSAGKAPAAAPHPGGGEGRRKGRRGRRLLAAAALLAAVALAAALILARHPGGSGAGAGEAGTGPGDTVGEVGAPEAESSARQVREPAASAGAGEAEEAVPEAGSGRAGTREGEVAEGTGTGTAAPASARDPMETGQLQGGTAESPREIAEGPGEPGGHPGRPAAGRAVPAAPPFPPAAGGGAAGAPTGRPRRGPGPPLRGDRQPGLAELFRRPQPFTEADFQGLLHRARTTLERNPANAAAAALETYARGGLAYAQGDDAGARRAASALRGASGATELLTATGPAWLPREAALAGELTAWQLAVLYCDARGEGMEAVNAHLADHPGDLRAVFGRAFLQHLHRRPQAALEDAAQAFRLAMSEDHAAAPAVALFAAEASLSVDQPAEAVAWLRRAVETGGDRAPAIALHAGRIARDRAGDEAAALDLFRYGCENGNALACRAAQRDRP